MKVEYESFLCLFGPSAEMPVERKRMLVETDVDIIACFFVSMSWTPKKEMTLCLLYCND